MRIFEYAKKIEVIGLELQRTRENHYKLSAKRNKNSHISAQLHRSANTVAKEMLINLCNLNKLNFENVNKIFKL